MLSLLALLGASIFIWWIYRWDKRTNAPVSGALWVPTLWMMRCGSRTVDAWFGGSELGRLDPVVIAVLIVAALMILVRRPCNWGVMLGNNTAVLVFCGYLFASVTWAGLDSPAVKIMRPLGDLLMAMVVATEPKPLTAIMAMFRRTSILLIPMSIVLIKYFPALGRGMDKHWGSDPWIGVTTHKNPLGQLCIVSALAFLWLLVEAKRRGLRLKDQKIAWIYLAMTAYLMHGGGNENSQSSTSMLCLMIAVALFFVLGRFRTRPYVVLRAIVAGIVFIGCTSLVLDMFGTSLQEVTAKMQGKDATLSDRTYLWADVIRLGLQNPVLGSGYGGFWVQELYEKLSPEVNNEPAQAHNGYLEVFANLGLVGVGLLAVMVVQSVLNAARTMRVDFDYGRARLMLLIMVCIMNYSEATFSRGTHLWWFGFLVFAVHPTLDATTSSGPGDSVGDSARDSLSPFPRSSTPLEEPVVQHS